jgi:structure-specific recognition protein 1
VFLREQLNEQYKGRLEKEMSGPVYEVVSKIFRVLMDQKITVPGSFVGCVLLHSMLIEI